MMRCSAGSLLFRKDNVRKCVNMRGRDCQIIVESGLFLKLEGTDQRSEALLQASR